MPAYHLLLAIALALPIFSVSMKSGVFRCQSFMELLRTALSMAVFLSLLFVAGWFVSGLLRNWVSSIGWILGISLLLILGLKLLFYTFDKRGTPSLYNVGNISVLIALSIATGMNGFVAGMAYCMLGVGLFPLIYFIAVLALLFSIFGIVLGKMKGNLRITRFFDLASGILIILLAAIVLLNTIYLV